ncbi:hypothetical protein N181_23200 [Sinorhizobium fredii USDA 205]|uniref:Uncharacterized protein n=1 Tax=Rhizobium fredii TaxID=380 RepID=A0A844A145_RHIFR|nr:hypothetical protein [Sinorhizobium fredii]KSV85569.1 hypothetical protein N181_23200 [Sinorhizobium fredii USDA 205]MQX06794.1 hypothetical protein [Sinorhizobium fredii]GEC34027.1 hypothetical protein EFR01_41980 [Sinorhizobium fredii]GLS06429.1 hypothetical protein GCM10007864_00530 [Sinorhizobium fredii]
MTEHAPMPNGWFDLVTDLRLALMRDYPDVAVTAMTADRGWLHVRVDDSTLDPAARLRLDRILQGFVTQSLTTCMCCGSHNGRDRGERKQITCDICDEMKETCNA